MPNTEKYTNGNLELVFTELEKGISIRKALEKIDGSWSGFLKAMKRKEIRAKYEQSKKDGIEFLLSNSIDLLNDTIKDFKQNGRNANALATSHLIKEILSISRWRAEKLLPTYQKHSKLSHQFETPLTIKWQKD
jgi:hypothetical protein|tara:strand:+ start:358 stop:759 length:402 start_codon:yes stop_codon:yes gene_type:complete